AFARLGVDIAATDKSEWTVGDDRDRSSFVVRLLPRPAHDGFSSVQFDETDRRRFTQDGQKLRVATVLERVLHRRSIAVARVFVNLNRDRRGHAGVFAEYLSSGDEHLGTSSLRARDAAHCDAESEQCSDTTLIS